MKQAFNPFLPINEYVPDGEPHEFDGRVYIYGSHDREGGWTFCMDDYVTYSAPVDDLTDWRYEGVIYKASQDPDYVAENPKGEIALRYMYAPDVVRGNDGRYYLYYAMSGDYGQGGYTEPIHVAVCDSPCGKFEYLGAVRYADGSPMWKYVCFDPAVINDNGVIRLYYGTQYDFEEREDYAGNEGLIQAEMGMFGRTREEILEYQNHPESCVDSTYPDAKDSIMGAVGCVLEDDMLTIKEEPKHIIPYRVKNTSFEEHPFFEASSMRKVGEKYYFVYSSQQNHELCYATSDYPDHGFTFGGTIVSNGDVGLEGRTEADRHNMTGTTHGSIIELNGQWYVFYHRLTHKSDYSRQACAEKIYIEKDGSIKQVEITSCGMNPGPLVATPGMDYPATIACIITNGRMPHGCNSIYDISFPNVSHLGDDRFIAEIGANTLMGYKYFDYKNVSRISLEIRDDNDENRLQYDGPIRVDGRANIENYDEFDMSYDKDIIKISLSEDGDVIGEVEIPDLPNWTFITGDVKIPDGVNALFLRYTGNKKIQIKTVRFE